MLSDATANRDISLFPTDVQISNTILDQLVDVLDEYADSETIMEQAEVHSNFLIIIPLMPVCRELSKHSVTYSVTSTLQDGKVYKR